MYCDIFSLFCVTLFHSISFLEYFPCPNKIILLSPKGLQHTIWKAQTDQSVVLSSVSAIKPENKSWREPQV